MDFLIHFLMRRERACVEEKKRREIIAAKEVLALDQVLRDLVKFDLFSDFNNLSKEE
jgi:hypothetical protein